MERRRKYDALLPSFPNARGRDGRASPLTESFDGTREHAQAMLLSYLRGSASYFVGEIKDQVRKSGEFKKLGVQDFRSRAAKQIRDRSLRDRQFNFLDLAFRYRGKANYRDAVFLAYGSQHLGDATEFVRDLAMVARFATICGLVYTRKRVGSAIFRDFYEDMRSHFDGYAEFRSFRLRAERPF